MTSVVLCVSLFILATERAGTEEWKNSSLLITTRVLSLKSIALIYYVGYEIHNLYNGYVQDN